MNKIIWFAVILAVILVLCNLIPSKQIEAFGSSSCSTENPSLTDLGSNPMVDRDGQNVIVTPSGGLSKSSSISIDSSGTGWKPTLGKKNNASLVVNLKKLTKIHYVVTSGIKLCRVYYSRNDNNVYSYEEVLYQNVNQSGNDNNKASIHFEAPSHNDVMRFGNLTTSDGQPVFAKYIKIVPLNLSETAKRGQYSFEDSSSDGKATQNVGSRGVKVDVYGLSPDATPIKGGESLLGSAKFYNENGKLINGSAWVGESGNSDSKLKISFHEDGQTVPRTIYSLIFTNSSNTQYVQEFSITYLHSKSKLTETIYNIKGNTNCGDSNRIQYYFDHPIIATSLSIRPTKLAYPGKPASLKIVDIMGAKINDVQEKVLLDKNKNKYCSSNDPDGCGSVSDLLGKQAEIQQLCDALELQDKIKENNQRIDKNRQYLLQLEDQDTKIANLEKVIGQMKDMRSLRQTQNDTGMLDQKEKQSKIDKQLKTLVAERRKHQKQFQLKLNIGEKSMGNLQSNVEKMEKEKGTTKGNNTATTNLEGFVGEINNNVQPNPYSMAQKFLGPEIKPESDLIKSYLSHKKRNTYLNVGKGHSAEPKLKVNSQLHSKEGFTSRQLNSSNLNELDGYATVNLQDYKNKLDHNSYVNTPFLENDMMNQTQNDPNVQFVKKNLN